MIPMIDWLDQMAKDLRLDKLPKIEQKRIFSILQKKYDQELEKTPKIAFIGKCGSGKSSTINSLFNAGLPVSHTNAGTLSTTEILVAGDKGDLIIYDMPGFGEDIEKDQEYLYLYKDVLGECDAVVWVLSATDRSLSQDQAFFWDLKNLVTSDWASRLVIGINKADLIYPNNWNNRINLPSRKQEKNLVGFAENVVRKFKKVHPKLRKDRIIEYSAAKAYNLTRLFRVMLEVAPDNRAWLLGNKGNIADYWTHVDADIRNHVYSQIGG